MEPTDQLAVGEHVAGGATAGESTFVEIEPSRPNPLIAAWALTWREMVRFLRQPNRIVSAVGQPILLWLLFSVGLHRAFRLSPAGADGGSFQEYYFPGTLMLIVLFTAIFATISIIEDRKEGFLQSVLVAPLPRWSMVLGKVLGGTLLAVAQGLIFLLLALTFDNRPDVAEFAGTAALLFVSAAALTSCGVVMAWRTDSVQGFHAIMSLLLLPMWLLSGAFFPIPALATDASWLEMTLHWLMRVNPLTYCVAAARHMLVSVPAASDVYTPELWLSWTVAIGFFAVTFAAACIVSRGRTKGDLL